MCDRTTSCQVEGNVIPQFMKRTNSVSTRLAYRRIYGNRFFNTQIAAAIDQIDGLASNARGAPRESPRPLPRRADRRGLPSTRDRFPTSADDGVIGQSGRVRMDVADMGQGSESREKRSTARRRNRCRYPLLRPSLVTPNRPWKQILIGSKGSRRAQGVWSDRLCDE